MTLAVLTEGAFTGAETVGHLALGLGGLVVVLIVGALVASFSDGPTEEPSSDPAGEVPPPVASIRG